jgi:hypothetical protein
MTSPENRLASWEQLIAQAQNASIDGHNILAAMVACQKSIPKNATTKIRRIRLRVSRAVSPWEVSPLGSLMRNYSVARQRADLTRH